MSLPETRPADVVQHPNQTGQTTCAVVSSQVAASHLEQDRQPAISVHFQVTGTVRSARTCSSPGISSAACAVAQNPKQGALTSGTSGAQATGGHVQGVEAGRGGGARGREEELLH